MARAAADSYRSASHRIDISSLIGARWNLNQLAVRACCQFILAAYEPQKRALSLRKQTGRIRSNAVTIDCRLQPLAVARTSSVGLVRAASLDKLRCKRGMQAVWGEISIRMKKAR